MDINSAVRNLYSQASGSPEVGNEEKEKFERPANWGDERWQVYEALNWPSTQIAMLGLILASIIGLVLETDGTALHGEAHLSVIILNRVLILFFAGEVCAEAFVYRRDFFRKGHGDRLACFCVLADLLVFLLDILLADFIPLTFSLRTMRVLRILRTARVFQIIQKFPELNYLLTQMRSAFFTIFWGLIMVLLVLLMWSIFIVNIFHPYVQTIVERNEQNNVYVEDAEVLKQGFASVWNTMVTLTQTLVAGDAWGASALPIIYEHPWAYFIFLFALGTVPLCVMNLILAAIVDSGAKTREEAAFRNAAGERARLAEEENRKKEYALELFREIDEDESGFLTLGELLEGFEKNEKFRTTMRELEFESIDLEILFRVLDKNNSGNIDYNECLSAVIDAKMVSSQHMLVFVKFALMDLWRRQAKIEDKLEVMLTLLGGSYAQEQRVKVDGGNRDKDDLKEKAKTSKAQGDRRREPSPHASKREGGQPTGKRSVSPRSVSPAARKSSTEVNSKKADDTMKQLNGKGNQQRLTKEDTLMSNGSDLGPQLQNGTAGIPKSTGTQTSQTEMSDSKMSDDTMLLQQDETMETMLSLVGNLETMMSRAGTEESIREDTMLSQTNGYGDLRHTVLELSYQTKRMVAGSQAQSLQCKNLDERVCSVLERLQLPQPNKTSTLL